MKGQVAHRTLCDQMRALRLFMDHVGKNIQLQKISPRVTESFVAARLASGVKVTIVNKDIRTLKRILNLAIEPRGYLSSGNNPFERIKQHRKAEKTIRFVSLEEYRALMNRAVDVRWKALLTVAYSCSLRRNEILNLTWADVDFAKQQIYVRTREETADVLEWEPKDHENRVLPAPNQRMQLLADLQAISAEGCPYVFVPVWRWQYIQHARQQGRWHEGLALVNNLGRQFHRLRRSAGVADCTLHDLRRSCMTNWARNLPIHVVQKLAGHSDIKTTQKYYLVVQKEDLEKARQVQSRILGSDLTDPLLTHSGQNEVLSENAAGRNSLAAKELE